MTQSHKTDVCIIGCGPAGALLGLLCARAGLDVTVVERQKQFEREFRGEGITPGGVKTLREHGVLDLLRPDQYVTTRGMQLYEDGQRIFEADFRSLALNVNFAIDLPQPTLIQAIVDASRPFSNYHFMAGYHPSRLIRDSAERVTGLVVKGTDDLQIDARVVIGADGRYSAMRKLGKFAFVRRDMKRDVVWFRLPKPSNWNEAFTRVNIIGGRHLIILPCFPDLLRVGMYMPKGGYAEYKRQGFDRFCRDVVALEPRFEGLVQEHVQGWKDVMLLDIFTIRVQEWVQDGLLLIGDAAHTCSPILGQGVNLALRDAAELAPALAELLLERKEPIVLRSHLLKFERKRQRDIEFIRGFQNRNELLLSFNSWLTACLRRALYRVFNVLPLKPFLLSRIALGVRQLSPGDG